MQETENPLKQVEEFRKALKKKFDYKQKVKRTMLDRDSQEFLDTLNGNIEKCTTELEMQKKLLKIEETKVENQEHKVRDIEKKLQEARQELKEAQQSAKTCLKEKVYAEVKRCEAGYKLAEFKRMQVEFGRTILLHWSATRKQVLAHANGKIVSTNRNKKILEEAGIIVDEIFKPAESEHLITMIPAGMEDKYQPLEWQSIIDYCEMAANFKMAAELGEEENIVLLYSNPDIIEILKANGLEAH